MAEALAPLRIRRYRVLWLALMVSNLGSFLQTVAGSWLMKELTNSSATWVGLMVAANLLPLLFLALVAGVVADVFDRAKIMLVSMVVMGLAATAMAVLTALDRINPPLLLGLGLMIGTGMAFNLPAWQSMVSDLVPRDLVPSAVALNSAGFNVARAVGPALGGLIVATSGPELGFALNAVSYLGVILVAPALSRRMEPPERDQTSMTGAIALSLRFARFTPAFRRLLGLVALFTVTSAVVQSTLPILTEELGGSETTYGILLGAMGLGALLAAAARPWVVRRLGARMVPATITLFGLAGIGLGLAPSAPLAVMAMLVSGAAWVWTLTTLNATSQLMAPEWIRGRAMSLYSLAFAGVYPLGSVLSGVLADLTSAGTAVVVFSVGVVAVGLSAPRFRIPQLGEVVPPEFSRLEGSRAHIETEGGPVMVINTWEINRTDVEGFLDLMNEIRRVRLRTGAYRWRLYRNTEDPHRLSEVFLCTSWEQHLAQHRRIDDASAATIRKARGFDRRGEPETRHLVAVDVAHPEQWESLILAHQVYHRRDGSIPLPEE